MVWSLLRQRRDMDAPRSRLADTPLGRPLYASFRQFLRAYDASRRLCRVLDQFSRAVLHNLHAAGEVGLNLDKLEPSGAVLRRLLPSFDDQRPSHCLVRSEHRNVRKHGQAGAGL